MNTYGKDEIKLLVQTLAPLFITTVFSFIYVLVKEDFSSLYFSIFSVGLIILAASFTGAKSMYFAGSTLFFALFWLLYFNWSTLFGLH